MKIGFVLFSKYHQKKDIGSSRMRGEYLIKNMPEAEEFIQGKKYDVIVFQKVYWKEMMRSFKGIKILDLCDPDWHETGIEIVKFLNLVDAITTSTEALKKEVEQFTDTPVYYIPDRLDFESLPKLKTHKIEGGKAKTCVWFGYSHNIESVEPAIPKLKKEGLTLKIISDGNYNSQGVENVKWDIQTAYKEIQKADFALFPEYKSGKYTYKSNNKTILSWALGLPVAKTADDVEKFLYPVERIKEVKKRLKEVKEKYDVKQSAKELMNIINERHKIRKTKTISEKC